MTADEYAILVLSKEERDCTVGGDGALSWNPAAARRTLLEDARTAHSKRVRAHEVLVREHEAALADHEKRSSLSHDSSARRSTLAQRDWHARRDAFMAEVRFEDRGSEVHVWLPSGQGIVCTPERVETTLNTRFELANPKPAGTRVDQGRPRHPGPAPRPPDEAELLRNFQVERRASWVATLATPSMPPQELAIAATERIEPPPSFVTRTLNAVAAKGWTVHHVAEDRAMDGDAVTLVSARYLLRRDAGWEIVD